MHVSIGRGQFNVSNFPFEDFKDDLFILHNSGVEHGLNHVTGPGTAHNASRSQ